MKKELDKQLKKDRENDSIDSLIIKEKWSIKHKIIQTPDYSYWANQEQLNADYQIRNLHFYTTVGKHDGCSLHDPAAVIACTHPELFTPRAVPITVSCDGNTSGATLLASDLRGATDALMAVDAPAVKQQFMNVMCMLD
jgi:inosine-uridine nucleoside N-ribohydrolase